MSRRQPEIGDVVRITHSYARDAPDLLQHGDIGMVVDHEQEPDGRCWWIVQTFNGGRDGYTPSAWSDYFEIVEEKKDGTHVQEQ